VENQKKSNEKELNSIKIKSIQAANLYKVNNWRMEHSEDSNKEKKPILYTGTAVINKSLFLKHMANSLIVDKYGGSKDFIILKFDNGIKDTLTAKNLREYYYINGADVFWEKTDKNGNVKNLDEKPIHYVRLMRSPGKAKKGECIFIREDLFKKAKKFISMDLYDELPAKRNRN